MDKKQIKNWKPFCSNSGEDASAMEIFSMELFENGELVSQYNNPISVNTGGIDKGSRQEGSAFFSISRDGKNTPEIIETGSGNVVHLGKLHNYDLAIECNKKNVINNWVIKAKIGTQEKRPQTFFEIMFFPKEEGRERDHINDPHVCFGPDGSGKYIRFNLSKEIKVETIKYLNNEVGLFLPSETKITLEGLEIKIIYSFSKNILSIVEIK